MFKLLQAVPFNACNRLLGRTTQRRCRRPL